MWLKSFFKKLCSAAIDLIYPKHCVICRKHILEFTEVPICTKCKSLSYTSNCVKDDKYVFDEAVGALKYEDGVRETMRKYKFQDIGYYAGAYAYFMDKATENRTYFREALICPVPLSSGRTRSYNQTALIARELAAMWNSEYNEELLYKSEEIKPLSGMKLPERQFYIEGAIAINPEYCVSGKDILLIDDIYTSGTTTNECARILKSYGARKVYVLCACYD